MRKLFRVLAIAVLGIVLVAVPVLAQTYYSDISLQETSGNSYSMLAVKVPLNVSNLVSQGYISSTGLDTRVNKGTSAIPHMLAEDRLLFATSLSGNSTNPLSFTAGNSALSSFCVITGYGGYVTTPDDASIELGDDFEVELKGYVDITSGGNLISKSSAFVVDNSADGEITATAYNTNGNSSATATGISSGEHTIKVNTATDAWLSFDGAGGVDCGNDASLDISSAFTIELWVNFNDISAPRPLVCKRDSAVVQPFTLYHHDVTGWSFGASSDGATWGTLIETNQLATTNTWYYVVVTHDGSVTRLYVNNVEIGSDNTPANPQTGTGYNVYIGTRGGQKMDGFIDEVRIYDRAIAASERQANYNAGRNGEPTNTSGLVGWWRFNDWDGTTATDSSGNGNNGTINGAWWAPVQNGSFENGDPPDDWTANNATLSQDADSHQGNFSIKVVPNGTWSRAEQSLPNYECYKGAVLTLTVWVKNCEPDNIQRISIKDGVGTTNIDLPQTCTWTQYRISRTINNAATYVKIYLYANASTNSDTDNDGYVLFDDLKVTVLKLYVDDTLEDTYEGTLAVEDNGNSWVFMNGNSVPYMEYLTIDVGGVEKLRYQPDSIISGTTLPDETGANDGTITWGANPSGVSVIVDPLTAYEAAWTTAEDEPPDVLGEIGEIPGMFPSDEDMEGRNNILYFLAQDVASNTNTPIQFFWWLLCAAFVIITLTLVHYHFQNMWITGLAVIFALGACVGMSFLPAWFVVLAILFLIGIMAMERKTSF